MNRKFIWNDPLVVETLYPKTLKEKEQQKERSIKNLHSALRFVQKHQQVENEATRTDDKADAKQSMLMGIRFANDALQTEQFLNDAKQAETNKKKFTMGYRKLMELSAKGPTEILLDLDDPRSGFMELLNSNSIQPGTVSLILTVLAKVCLAQELRLLASLVNKIASKSQFLQKHILKYLVDIQIGSRPDIDLYDSLEALLSFLSKFQEIQPVTSSDILTCIIPSLNTTLEKLKKRFSIIKPSVNKRINDLELLKESIINQHDPKTRKQIAMSEQLHSEPPPEDYRVIPVLPTNEDFTNKRPFLRPNIVRGSYMDATHYLDVQFRLLREDYVRPLRESVEAFKKASGKKESKRISVYRNVQVLCPFNTEGGLVHLISFDVKPFAHVRWEVSKRFMLGSLLCLSCDNFESMMFATVAKRDPQQLKEGRLEVHFEDLNEEIFSISPSALFVMVESEAYFEAFRHTLASLQKMNEDTLPLKDYIVRVKKSVDPPRYLTSSSCYDFFSTFDCLKEFLATSNKFPVLSPTLWPSCDQLGLDQSQYSALQAALTKEFAIIQGPPGTGKTYIGLKITQMLVENSTVWQSRNSTILVVCYTNHALDQFLEGILSFTDSIVRIGGRSSSEQIKRFQLGELRQAARNDKKVPFVIHRRRIDIMKKIKVMEQHIDFYTEQVERSTQQILPFPFLQPYMGRRLSDSLTRYLQQYHSLEYKYYAFHEWLYVPTDFEVPIEDNGDDFVLNEDEDDIKQDYEDDIDFELSLREIDNSEYSHIGGTDGWKTKAKRKRRFVRKQIESWDTMTSEEAKKVRNVWKLDPSQRWRLYRLWVAQYITNLLEILTSFQKTYHEECEKLRELRAAEDKLIIKQAKVVGMTTTGAGKYREYLQELNPQIVIVEEAAEVLEAHIVTSLTSKTQHLVLIGDHQQLKPSPTVYELATRYSLDISLFERMINNGMSFCQLTKQHRMRPCIAKLLTPHIYKNLENHHSVERYENVVGVGKNMFFINHCFQEGDIVDTKSHSNLHEAHFLVALCKYLRLQGYDASSITVLTTYSGQLFTIRQLMKGQTLLDGVRVTVVDNFQGEENDIILISFVRSNDDGSIGFLKVSNRVCVALSRARKGLYCIGNFELFVEESKLWKNIVHDLEEQKAIGTSLVLCCQNHPNVNNKVATAEDFKKRAPDGGCLQPCDFRLSCGHVCPKLCHPDDRSHSEIQCKRKCDKILCSLEHECPKLCYEKCGKCVVPQEKYRSLCGHTISVPCHVEANDTVCPLPCNKALPCGHSCVRCCSDDCKLCIVEIKKKFECGHHVTVACYKASDVMCQEPCERQLPCGHKCGSQCGIVPCPPCKHVLKKLQPCGHETEISCSDLETKGDPLCEEACSKKMECMHECQSACGHDGSCGPCDQPCKKVLQCSHRCVRKCHEVCSILCEACESFSRIAVQAHRITKRRYIPLGYEYDDDDFFSDDDDYY